MASIVGGGNKYRDYLSEEEVKNTKWRNGPPTYDVVDKLFEEERTHVCFHVLCFMYLFWFSLGTSALPRIIDIVFASLFLGMV